MGQTSLRVVGLFLAAAPLVMGSPACGQPAPLHAPADPIAARAEIQSTLDIMARAVLAGDPDAYLAHVWRDDPDWSTEQVNWAADLKRKVPAEFEFTVGDVTPEVDESWAQAKATMKWSFTGGKPREQSYVARFFRHPDHGWLYAGEKWNVLEREGVRVLYDDDQEEAARTVADVLPTVRTHVLTGFELLGKPIEARVQQVKLYRSMRHLQQSIYLSYTDSLGGWNEPHEAIKLLSAGVRGIGGARVLLAHEYGHVATFELGDHASDMPWWALEGVAELSSEKFSGGAARADAAVRGWARKDKLIDWPRLADFHGEATSFYAQVYAQGHHMLGYVSDRFGRSKRNAWLTRMAQGITLDQATREALGLTFADLDAQWRASLAPDAPKPAASKDGTPDRF
jgi:hypothetical protein